MRPELYLKDVIRLLIFPQLKTIWNIIGYFVFMDIQPDPPHIPKNVLSLAEEKQAMLAAIVATSDDAIISKTLDGIITTWNHAAEYLFGYSEAEVVGRHISMIIPTERYAEEDYIMGQISKGKRIEHFETFRLRKDGKLIPLSVSVSPIINKNGKVIGASKIARDMSERQRSEEKDGILAAIIATSDDTIISKTLEGIITSWNPAAERMFGYTETEAIGQHISLIIPLDRYKEETYIIGQIAAGKKIEHFETIRQHKNGREIAISVSVSPVTDAKGNIIGASKIARDISARLAAEEENTRLYQQIKALNEKKDEFIGLASHELKTPLTSISGYLQIMDRVITDNQARSFLAKTRQQVGKLTALIGDLLDVSKIEAGKLQLAAELFDIRQLTADTIEVIRLNNPAHEINLNAAPHEMMVTGDPHRVEQVIINLLTNAIRYAPKVKRIEVTVTQNSHNVQVAVKDFGIGIAPEQLSHIFSRFYRVDNLTPSISGLGIGLYLSHEIITRHNGRIWAESETGRGSTFYFSLPL